MIKGITPSEEEIIKSILLKYPFKFYYYGSRVKGDYTIASDLDVLVRGEQKVDNSIIADIEKEFNESKIPYRVNISDYNGIDVYFYELIKNDLIEVL